MRFDQIDLFVMLSRNLGGILIAIGIGGGIVAYAGAGPREAFSLWPWISLALSGVWLVNFTTGVLAQIGAARAAQDGVLELRAIREALKGRAA